MRNEGLTPEQHSCMECRKGKHDLCEAWERQFCECRQEGHKK